VTPCRPDFRHLHHFRRRRDPRFRLGQFAPTSARAILKETRRPPARSDFRHFRHWASADRIFILGRPPHPRKVRAVHQPHATRSRPRRSDFRHFRLLIWGDRLSISADGGAHARWKGRRLCTAWSRGSVDDHDDSLTEGIGGAEGPSRVIAPSLNGPRQDFAAPETSSSGHRTRTQKGSKPDELRSGPIARDR
jgi:hypothetical protein